MLVWVINLIFCFNKIIISVLYLKFNYNIFYINFDFVCFFYGKDKKKKTIFLFKNK